MSEYNDSENEYREPREIIASRMQSSSRNIVYSRGDGNYSLRSGIAEGRAYKLPDSPQGDYRRGESGIAIGGTVNVFI